MTLMETREVCDTETVCECEGNSERCNGPVGHMGDHCPNFGWLRE